MALRLTPEDEAEYLRRCAINRAAKEEAIRLNDKRAAKRARQANTALYHEFELRQTPMPYRPRLMTLEERVQQIEAQLGISDLYI